MLHPADGVAVRLGLLALRDLEEREETVVPHVEEIVADAFPGRVSPIAGSGAHALRHLHRMYQRHADHVDEEFGGRLHVLRRQRQMVHAARNDVVVGCLGRGSHS